MTVRMKRRSEIRWMEDIANTIIEEGAIVHPKTITQPSSDGAFTLNIEASYKGAMCQLEINIADDLAVPVLMLLEPISTL